MKMLPRFYLDDVFDNFIDKSFNSNIMRCDIFENDSLYTIEIDIPGFKKDDINIDVDNNNYLTVSVSKKNETDDSNKNYIRRERSFGEYKRIFYVGSLDTDKIEAKFEDGILTINIPKKEIDNSSKRIDIM